MAHRLSLRSGGLFISKAGADALSTAYDDLLVDAAHINTRAKLAGIVTGTGTLVPGSDTYHSTGDYYTATYQIIVAHGLGYIPQFFTAAVSTATLGATIDTTNLVFTFSVSAPGHAPPTNTTNAALAYVIFFDRWV